MDIIPLTSPGWSEEERLNLIANDDRALMLLQWTDGFFRTGKDFSDHTRRNNEIQWFIGWMDKDMYGGTDGESEERPF